MTASMAFLVRMGMKEIPEELEMLLRVSKG